MNVQGFRKLNACSSAPSALLRCRASKGRMKKVERDEILDIAQYEKSRPDFRRRVIEIKKQRRVQVGPKVTFVFENHDTVLFQIQEMMRTERIVEEAGIRHEIETYNQILGDKDELAATMLIELTDPSRIREEISKLHGMNSGRVTWLQVGEEKLPGNFDPGQSNEERISAVQYVRFHFGSGARAAFLETDEPLQLVIDHPNYQFRTTVGAPVLSELRRDLL